MQKICFNASRGTDFCQKIEKMGICGLNKSLECRENHPSTPLMGGKPIYNIDPTTASSRRTWRA
jgi:hypothetical protein